MTNTAPRRACALQRVGVVSALGVGRDETWGRLITGEQNHFIQREDLVPGKKGLYGAVTEELPEVPASLANWACRTNQLLLAAFEQMSEAVGIVTRQVGTARVGVVVGTSTSGLSEAETAFRMRHSSGELPGWFKLDTLEFGGPAQLLAEVIGAYGPRYTISTACSSGAKALASARSLLELQVSDAVVAGGVDSLCRLTATGFHSLQAVARELTNPMSKNRDGLTLGEGAALFLLTRETTGIQLLGAGESMDAYHMSAPRPDGRGAETAMRQALAEAGMPAASVAYLNLHGTGTPQNDAMESLAVARVFDAIPCSSTKPLTGHTLGASGALEAAFCWLILDHWGENELRLPPHRYDGERDPGLPHLNLTGEDARVEVGRQAIVMSNSFGFGGSNCALVLGRERS